MDGEGPLRALRGVARRVTIPLSVRERDGAFSAAGEVAIRGTDFGMDPYSALFGAVRNADELTLVIDVRGEPAG